MKHGHRGAAIDFFDRDARTNMLVCCDGKILRPFMVARWWWWEIRDEEAETRRETRQCFPAGFAQRQQLIIRQSKKEAIIDGSDDSKRTG